MVRLYKAVPASLAVQTKAGDLQAIRARVEIGQVLLVINPAMTEVMPRRRSSRSPQHLYCGILENQYVYLRSRKW
jgi:hypothetical protein